MGNVLKISLEFAVMYSVITLGVYIVFKILSFPDLSLEMSYVLGGAVSIVLTNYGCPIIITIIMTVLSGTLVATTTSVLHVKLGIGKILSSILSLNIFYALGLRILSSPNVSLNKNSKTILNMILDDTVQRNILMVCLMVLLAVIHIYFFNTKYGYIMRASGGNDSIANIFATNDKMIKWLGLSIGSILMAIAGGIIAQYQEFADINMGSGVVITGIASLMIGEAVIPVKNSIIMDFLGVIIGTFFYQIIINACLYYGITGAELKFVTAVIIIAIIALKRGGRMGSYEVPLSRY